jgi:4-hydroxy-tetrahydrodipicolinate synthase
LGSTGEFLSVADDERTQLIEAVVGQAKGRIPVIVGTAAEWADEAVRYSREAERLGAAGVMVIPPFYATPTEDELFEHYRLISEAISIPIMVYNNPFTSNVDLKPSFVARLGQLDNVLYIKESSGDITRVREIERLSDGKVTVFAGYHAYDSFVLGAKGWVSVCGNIVPRLSADLYRITATQGDLVKGRELYHRLLPLLDAISGDLYVSATKAAMKLVGMSMGEPRMPRLPLPKDRIAGLKRALSEVGALAKKAA